MQKKILASLLMVPMAYSAFADIKVDVPVTKEDWNTSGIVGDKLTFDEETQSINSANAPIGAGVLTTTKTLTAPGQYSLSFKDIKNAKVEIFVNGKDVTPKAENFTYNFDVTGGVKHLRTCNPR